MMQASRLLGWFMLSLAGPALAWHRASEQQLRSALESSEDSLIIFVLPDADGSNALEAEWKTVQKMLKDNVVLSFDCGAQLEVCQELDIASYPAVRHYHREKGLTRYRGERKASEIIAFLKRTKRASPVVIEPTAPPPLQEDTVVFLAYYAQNDDRFRNQYKTLASRYRDSHTFILSRTIEGQDSSLHCTNNIDELEHTAEAIESVGDLESFVKTCSSPLIPELTRANEAEYSQTGKSLLHFFFTTLQEKEKYRAEMRPLAKKYSEFLHFALTDVSKYPEMLAYMGLKEGLKSGLSLENPNTGEVFPYLGKGKVTPPVVERFLDDVVEGRARSVRGGMGGGKRHDEL